MSACHKCGTEASSFASSLACPVCGALAGAGDGAATPWERMASIGLVRALLGTLQECLVSPSRFFSRLSLRSDTFMALLFALVMGSAQSLLSLVWSLAGSFLQSHWALLPGWVGGAGDASSSSTLAAGPMLAMAEAACLTALFHAGAALTRARPRSMGYTFRVCCYANAAAAATIVPFIGSLIAAVWFVVLLVTGLSAVHGMRTSRTVGALAMPLVLAGVALTFLVIVAAGAGIAAAGLLKDFSWIFR